MSMALDGIQRIAISFTVVFIVAAIFSSFAPGASQQVFAFLEEKLGFGEPSIGYFTVTPDKYGNEATVAYSILGNAGDVEKILVYHTAAIPPQMGEPDKDGIYSYQPTLGAYEVEVYYKYVFASSLAKVHRWLWQWSVDKKNWVSVETTAADYCREGQINCKIPGLQNKVVISYLNEIDPDPNGVGEVYPGSPSLTSNVVGSLQDGNGKIRAKVTEIDSNAWNKFTMELYISNGDVASMEAMVRVGVPADSVPHQNVNR